MEHTEIVRKVGEAFSDAVVATDEGATYLQIASEHWLAVAEYLRNDPALHFDSLMCLTGYDKGAGNPIGIAYNLHSMEKDHKLEVRIEVSRENCVIPSVALIWRTAEWHEREAYDMVGVTFTGHPDFRRILLPDDWVGYPLRKDYETPETYRGIPVPKDKRGWE